MRSTNVSIKTALAMLILALGLTSCCGQPVLTSTPTSPPTQLPTLTPVPTRTPSPTPTPTPTPTPLPSRRPITSPDDVEIDPAYGYVEAQFTGTGDQIIILIGENHASYKVQENVGRIGEQLLAQYDIRLLLIEGYEGTIDTGFFDALPDPAVRRQVAWAFLEAHEISGIEYAALTGRPEVVTIGVENMDLWDESLEATNEEIDIDDPVFQQIWDAFIDELIAVIELLPPTAELEKKLEDFIDEKISIVELHEYVLETAAEQSISTVELEATYRELEGFLNPVVRFASEREFYMVENSLEAMSTHDVNVSILLMGHAHFQGVYEEGGISKLLQDREVSYVYVLPNGAEDETTDEENQYYDDQLQGVPSALEVWLDALFKPKPAITRSHRRAEIEVVGKVAFLEALAQAGIGWDGLSPDHAAWLQSGPISVQDSFDVGGEFSIYPCRAQGKKGNETFIIAVSTSETEPPISHETDRIAHWQVSDRWFTAVKGRSADILIRRGIAATSSEPGKTFACAYEIDGGRGVAWQIGGQERVVPDVSWDTFNDLLDLERPVPDREEKIAKLLDDAFQGIEGPIVLLPRNSDYVPEGEGQEAYAEGKYFHPSYEDKWQLDWPALAILMGQRLQRPVYNDGNPVLAKENLDRQVPVRVDNLGVVVDEESMNDAQREQAHQIPEAIAQAGVAPETVHVSFSLDDFPSTSNVVLITAENDDELVKRLAELGEAGLLKDKFVVLLTCGDEGLREFAGWAVQAYGLTGLRVYRNKIYAESLPIFVGEMYRLANEQPDLMPAELVDRAILKEDLERLRNGWNQLSRRFDPTSENASTTYT